MCDNGKYQVAFDALGGALAEAGIKIAALKAEVASLRNTQQLKAEIRAMLSNRHAMSTVEFYAWIDNHSEQLRELSAV